MTNMSLAKEKLVKFFTDQNRKTVLKPVKTEKIQGSWLNLKSFKSGRRRM